MRPISSLNSVKSTTKRSDNNVQQFGSNVNVVRFLQDFFKQIYVAIICGCAKGIANSY